MMAAPVVTQKSLARTPNCYAQHAVNKLPSITITE